MLIETGCPFYGQDVGILVFSTITPRVCGDAGNNNSFSYPVRYEIVQGGYADLIEGSQEIKAAILTACKNLTALNIKAIVADCGMMSLYQDDMGAIANMLFVGSSLCQIPTIWQMLGRSGTIGVITGHSKLLSERHLLSSGWTEDMPLSIQGMEEETHFSEIVINEGLNLNVDKMREDVLSAGNKLQAKTRNLRAIVFECSNLATYSADLCEMLRVPVFDTISAANLVRYAVNPPRYL